ncbi:MAG: glycosyltransferase family 2 protein [Candidatus Paceibacterota bacterium]
MKISIIIPSYNLGRYIKRTIDSVIDQDYENKELIVIDGGSRDETVDILKSYGDKIFWISEKDKGQSDAINKGFKIATGDVVAWINADDYYEPNILSKVAEEFSKNKGEISILYGKCNSVSDTSTLVNTPPENISSHKLINSGNLIYQPSSFYDLDLVRKVGYLDDSLEYWMEYDLYIKLIKEKPSKYIDLVLSNFMVREDQKSNSKNKSDMDKELILISKRHGGGKIFSKIYIKNLLNKFKQ